MMSARSDSQSTILPLPSSPHWAPITTTLAISTPPAESLIQLAGRSIPLGCAAPLIGADARSEYGFGAIGGSMVCGLSQRSSHAGGGKLKDAQGGLPVPVQQKSVLGE